MKTKRVEMTPALINLFCKKRRLFFWCLNYTVIFSSELDEERKTLTQRNETGMSRNPPTWAPKLGRAIHFFGPQKVLHETDSPNIKKHLTKQ